jgi:hypothetical protein
MNPIRSRLHRLPSIAAGLALAAAAPLASATDIVITYEDLTENFYGTSYTHMGVTYRDINQVSGLFPTGETFGPQENEQVIIENATLAYDDFPEFGSPIHALTFGIAYINGDNLSIGRVSSVTMDLDQTMEHASFQMLYYENGPWGGISFHLDAILDGQVVASDSFVIADGGGRDNPAMASLSVSAAAFDQLHFYARYGNEYSLPRAIIDNLTLRPVAAGGCAADFDGNGAVNSNDISAFLAAWLADLAGGTLVADFDGSGVVNSNDISAFLAAWLEDVGSGC